MAPTPSGLLRDALIGAGVGLLVLGFGGRLAMRVIALTTDAPEAVSVGGTLTVVAMGAAAGAAGALLLALSRGVAARLPAGRGWAHHLLFAGLLGLVTARGLRGSPAGPSLAFWPLVLAYGALLSRILGRRAGGSGDSPAASNAPHHPP